MDLGFCLCLCSLVPPFLFRSAVFLFYFGLLGYSSFSILCFLFWPDPFCLCFSLILSFLCCSSLLCLLGPVTPYVRSFSQSPVFAPSPLSFSLSLLSLLSALSTHTCNLFAISHASLFPQYLSSSSSVTPCWFL